MQALYAHYQTEDTPLMNSERKLVTNIESIYDLYIYLISALLETGDFARNLMHEASKKFLPTEAEINPNTRFIENKLLQQFDANRDVRRHINRLKITWSNDIDIFRRIFFAFRESEAYLEYMNAPVSGYKQDKEIIVKLFTENLLASDAFTSLFEEKNLYWADDMDTAVMMVLKTIKKWGAQMDEFQPLPILITPDDEGEDLMSQFVLKLFRKTVINNQEYEKLIAERAQNWELERIALLDIILIKMALAEFTEFESIPIKVTINEYIEISKEYSTPRSRQFINGLLDKMATDLKLNGRIKKVGRGLAEES